MLNCENFTNELNVKIADVKTKIKDCKDSSDLKKLETELNKLWSLNIALQKVVMYYKKVDLNK